MDTLNWACATFLENLTTLFLQRAAGVQLLQTPPHQQSTLKTGLQQGGLGRAVPPRLWDPGSTQDMKK